MRGGRQATLVGDNHFGLETLEVHASVQKASNIGGEYQQEMHWRKKKVGGSPPVLSSFTSRDWREEKGPGDGKTGRYRQSGYLKKTSCCTEGASKKKRYAQKVERDCNPRILPVDVQGAPHENKAGQPYHN